MKNFFLLLLILPLLLLSCKKEYSAYTEPKTNSGDFVRVKRLVIVSGSDSLSYDFTFNADSSLQSVLKTEVVYGGTTRYVDSIYRDPSGKIIRTVWGEYGVASPFILPTRYNYSGGKLQSKFTPFDPNSEEGDSVVFTYQGALLKEQLSYNIIVSSTLPSVLVRKQSYQFDSKGNIVAIADSTFNIYTGTFVYKGEALFTSNDTLRNPLKLKSGDDIAFGLNGYFPSIFFPSVNFLNPYVLKQEVFQSSSSSNVITFAYQNYEVQSGRLKRMQVEKVDQPDVVNYEIRYYYLDE